MSIAQLFHDLVKKHILRNITSVKVNMVEHRPEHLEGLRESAKLILSHWIAETKGLPVFQRLVVWV